MRGVNAWIINKNRKTGEEKKETEAGTANERGEQRVGGPSISARPPGSLPGQTFSSALKWLGKSSATILGPTCLISL